MGHQIKANVQQLGVTALWQSNAYHKKAYNNYFSNDLLGVKKLDCILRSYDFEPLNIRLRRNRYFRSTTLYAVVIRPRPLLRLSRFRLRIRKRFIGLRRRFGKKGIAKFNTIVALNTVRQSRNTLNAFINSRLFVNGRVILINPIRVAKREVLNMFTVPKLEQNTSPTLGRRFDAVMNFYNTFPFLRTNQLLTQYFARYLAAEFRIQLQSIKLYRQRMARAKRSFANTNYYLLQWILNLSGKLAGSRRSKRITYALDKQTISKDDADISLGHGISSTCYGVVNTITNIGEDIEFKL